MNKTALIIGFFVLVALGLTASVIILIFRPEAIGTLTSTLVTVLGLATTAAVTFSALGKQNEKLEEIKTQGNGNLARRDAEIERLTNALVEATAKLPAKSGGAHSA